MTRERWQFGLRNFLLTALIAGPLVAFVGVPLMQALREQTPAALPTRATPPNSRSSEDAEASGYFESGETPLY